ncbi:unnamed protein product [Rotaria sp. Silwood1]|nr:unnamed protein product [Rotaria sp. Silwood1]
MDTHTHLEDLSNEIFFEIFDYLHALDIFTAFASLNKRILSILKSILLHVIILNSHYDREIQFLSFHLTFHAHQVISLKVDDTIRDRAPIISLLFKRHHFINLQSCIFMSINSLTLLDNVIKQVKSLNRLVTFVIAQPIYQNINEKYICDITRTILMHKSSFRSVMLRYNYDYLDISTYTSIASNLISLDLLMSSGSLNTVSVYSILPILRVCHRIRYLQVIINHQIVSENNNLNVSIYDPFINENDLHISPQVTTFGLSTFVICDIRSIAYILRLNSVQSNDNDDSQQCVTYLSHVVHLLNVNQIGFQSYSDTSGWKDIQFILQACPNVINLTISPLYLVLSEFIDN